MSGGRGRCCSRGGSLSGGRGRCCSRGGSLSGVRGRCCSRGRSLSRCRAAATRLTARDACCRGHGPGGRAGSQQRRRKSGAKGQADRRRGVGNGTRGRRSTAGGCTRRRARCRGVGAAGAETKGTKRRLWRQSVDRDDEKLVLRPLGQQLQLQKAFGRQRKGGLDDDTAESSFKFELAPGLSCGDRRIEAGAQSQFPSQGFRRVGYNRRRLRGRWCRGRGRGRWGRRDFGHDASESRRF